MAVQPLSGELLIGGQNSRVWDIAGTAAKWVLPLSTGSDPLGGAAFLSSDDLFLGPMKTYRAALLDLRGPSALWNPANGNWHMPTVSADGRFVAIGSSRFSA